MLPGADASVPNSVLRVISDVQGALCHLTLQFIDWLALQIMPDTAEREWLDRHANIWLVNSDGTTGRKLATLANGIIAFTGIPGTTVPDATRITTVTGAAFETTEEAVMSSGPTPIPARALDPGVAGNLPVGQLVTVTGAGTEAAAGIDGTATVVTMGGGTEDENDDDLRTRVLERIRQPPMGGDVTDYIAWAKAVPGVTRAWAAQEMGIGTVTVRFMADDLRSSLDGFPTAYDITQVSNYLNTVRPVAVKDIFVVAPIPRRIDILISKLVPDSLTIRANVEASLQDMLIRYSSPGKTVFAAWKAYAIMGTPGVESVELANWEDDLMPILGTSQS